PLTLEGQDALSEADFSMQAALSGLQNGTEYDFRLHLTYAGLAADSPEGHFATEPVQKPSVSLEAPSLINAANGSFYLAGHVNPGAPHAEDETTQAEQEAFRTTWRFECEPSCGAPSGEPLQADDHDHLVEAELENLAPNTKYTLTLHAENAGGQS